MTVAEEPTRATMDRVRCRGAGWRPPGKRWRREWDSNPRIPVKVLLEFQSSAFDHSAISPESILWQIFLESVEEAALRKPPGVVRGGTF